LDGNKIMEYRYGSAPNDVDEFFRAKRPWSTVKDKIVGDYIACYLKTVHNLRRPILIVDCFAGPGRFGDDTPGSPLIICNAINQWSRGRTEMSCLFADTRLGHRKALASNLAEYIRLGMSEPPYEQSALAIRRALELGAGSTVFFYLDPYGIKDLEFDTVRQIYARDPKCSTEVLINFNFRAFMRMSGNWSYGDSANDISRKVKEGKIDTVNEVMGGDYWHDIITDPKLDKIGREDAVVDAYLALVKKFFTFAYAIPVKERKEDEIGVPVDELARYHLIFGTRSPRAVVYMNDVALNSLEPYFRQFKEGLLFDFTPHRYQSIDREVAKKMILDAVRSKPLKRPEIYEAVIPRCFMHHRVKDFRAMIDELVFQEGRLHPDKQTLKLANKLNDNTLLSIRPWGR
jgi:three-Cys-motif partner protein